MVCRSLDENEPITRLKSSNSPSTRERGTAVPGRFVLRGRGSALPKDFFQLSEAFAVNESHPSVFATCIVQPAATQVHYMAISLHISKRLDALPSMPVLIEGHTCALVHTPHRNAREDRLESQYIQLWVLSATYHSPTNHDV